MLAGCTAYDRTADQFTQPVVKDVKKGMTRSQVLQTMANVFWGHYDPRTWNLPDLYPWVNEMVNLETLAFVALDDTGRVMNPATRPCAEYDTDPRNSK